MKNRSEDGEERIERMRERSLIELPQKTHGYLKPNEYEPA